MPNREALAAAVAAGVIKQSDADALSRFLEARERQSTESEGVRFARGFHDVFITVGVVLFLIGVGFAQQLAGLGLLGAAISLPVIWLLAEVLTARRRLVLPSIALALAFSLWSAVLGLFLFDQSTDSLADWADGSAIIASSAAAFLGMLVFYLRFRLPFALGLLAGGAVATLFGIVLTVWPDWTAENGDVVWLGGGLVLFLAGMAQDLRDPMRQTLRADNAFWLHLQAAPLIVHGIIGLTIGGFGALDNSGAAVSVLWIVAVLALVSVLIDRRAMLVSALGYLGFAIAYLVNESGLEGSTVATATLLALGALIIGLGVGWQRVRAVLLPLMPLGPLKQRLPPVRVAGAA